MPNSNTFLVTQAEREHVRQGARFQQHRDASCHQVFFFLQGKAPKEIHAILREITGEHAPSCTTVKNWVAQFKRGDFSTCDASPPGRNTTEIIDQIYDLTMEDRRISPKSIAEQLGISHERDWAHHSRRFGHSEALREVGPEMPERGIKTSTVPVV